MAQAIRYKDGTWMQDGTTGHLLATTGKTKELEKHMKELDDKWRKMEGRKPVSELTDREKMLEGRLPWDPEMLK